MRAETDQSARARHADAEDSSYAWLHDGSMPRTREDLIAEAVALFALVFSLTIGLVIAVLPVSARAATVQAAAPASDTADDIAIPRVAPAAR